MGARIQEPQPLRGDGGGHYLILVQGRLEHHWGPELGMQLAYRRTEWGTVSALAGDFPDQAALLGALGRLAMWGHLIVLVRYGAEGEALGAG